jgi:ketosteroid isomerase-like protein
MSRENLELVRRMYEISLFAATPEELDRAFREYLDENVEIRLPADYPEGEPVFRGREGLAALSTMLQETWGRWWIEPERFLDAGDRVVVFAHIRAEGGTSGVPVGIETTHVWTLRGGRGTFMQAHRDRTRALEAAGLRD